MREKHGISLRELSYVSGVPKPTIHLAEKGTFPLPPEREARVKAALRLLAGHKQAFRELPGKLARKLQETNRRVKK